MEMCNMKLSGKIWKCLEVIRTPSHYLWFVKSFFSAENVEAFPNFLLCEPKQNWRRLFIF